MQLIKLSKSNSGVGKGDLRDNQMPLIGILPLKTTIYKTNQIYQTDETYNTDETNDNNETDKTNETNKKLSQKSCGQKMG